MDHLNLENQVAIKMNGMKKLFLVYLFGVMVSNSFAQNYQLKISAIDGKNFVAIKWFSDSINFSNTFNLYRKTDGEASWVKLNANPIGAKTPLSNSELKKKEYSKAFTEYSVMMNMSEQDKQMFLPFLVVQSVTDNDLAEVIGHYYLDDTAPLEKSISYKLMLLKNGNEILLDDTTFTFHSFQKAISPTGFNIEAGNHAIKLKWKYNDAFPVYHIYRGTVVGKADTMLSFFAGAAMIDSFKKGKWMTADIDSNLSIGKKYFYKIAGVDYFGNETQYSEEVGATLLDMTLPSVVRQFVSDFVDDGKNVILHWKKMNYENVKGFNVYRATASGTSFTKMNSSLLSKTDTSFIDKTTTSETHYTYYIESEGLNGMKNNSVHIELTTADITPPTIPTGIRTSSDSVSITITWNQNPEKDLRGYFVFSALKPNDENFNLLTNVPITTNVWKDYYPKNISSKFYYKVCAIDSSYNRSQSSIPVSVNMPDMVAPTNTFIQSVSFTKGSVSIHWPVSNTDDIKGYKIFRCTDSISQKTQLLNPNLLQKSDSVFVDSKVITGHNYFYSIATVDSAGNQSSLSPFRMLNTNSTNIIAAPENVRTVYNTTSKSILITWTKQTDLNYQIFRSMDGGSFLPITDIASDQSYSDTEIESNHKYSYQLKAFRGETVSDFSVVSIVEVK